MGMGPGMDDYGDEYGDEMMMFGGRRGMIERAPPLPQLKEPEFTIDQKYIDIKEWERKYNKWLMSGGEKPGKHPDDNHDWNKNPDKYIIHDDEEGGGAGDGG